MPPTCEPPTITTIQGRAPGPTLAVLGGVHGNEYGGVLSAGRLQKLLAPSAFRGTVKIAAPAHPAAWQHDQRVCPEDGLNLARVFPGNPSGQPTEQVAAHLTAGLIAGADLLIDLHTAGAYGDMPLLVGYHADGTSLAQRSAAAADAFSPSVTWEHPDLGPGRSLGAAEELGVASIYVESSGSGRTRLDEMDRYHEGLQRVLHHLGMIDEAPAAESHPVVVRSPGDTDRGEQVRDGRVGAPADGLFVLATAVADRVEQGQLLGELWDETGEVLAEIASPQRGVVMMLRTATRVNELDTLAIVAEEV